MVMRIKQRLDRLEFILKVDDNLEQMKTQEYMRSWMDNDPDAIPIFKRFENHCIEKLGFTAYHQRKEWVELTKGDPVAEELARAFLESYRNHVLTHFGVKIEYAGTVLH